MSNQSTNHNGVMFPTMMPFGGTTILPLPAGYNQSEIPQLWADFIHRLPARGKTNSKHRRHKSHKSKEQVEKVSQTTKVDPDLVGLIIGKGGHTIKRLSREAGDRCFIKHLGDGEFEVFAPTNEICDKAIASIKKFEEEDSDSDSDHDSDGDN